jgi:hypothetical protein
LPSPASGVCARGHIRFHLLLALIPKIIPRGEKMSGQGLHLRRHVDANQAKIVKALWKIPGISVKSIAGIGHGCPDLLIGYRKRNYLWEIKNPDASGGMDLTVDEKKFHQKWNGSIQIVTCLDLALEYLGIK